MSDGRHSRNNSQLTGIQAGSRCKHIFIQNSGAGADACEKQTVVYNVQLLWVEALLLTVECPMSSFMQKPKTILLTTVLTQMIMNKPKLTPKCFQSCSVNIWLLSCDYDYNSWPITRPSITKLVM